MRHLTIAFERRRHDLPPRWDGRIVKWSEWDTSPTFVCGRPQPPAPRCEGCGSAARQAASRGTVYPLDGEMFETHEPRVKRTRSGREHVAGTVTVARRARPGTSGRADRAGSRARRSPSCRRAPSGRAATAGRA